MDLNPCTRALTYVEAGLKDNFEVETCRVETLVLKRDICSKIYLKIEELSQEDLYQIWLKQKEESLRYIFTYQAGTRTFSMSKKEYQFSSVEFEKIFNDLVLKQTQASLMDNHDLIIDYLLKGTMPNHKSLDTSCFDKDSNIIDVSPKIKQKKYVA